MNRPSYKWMGDSIGLSEPLGFIVAYWPLCLVLASLSLDVTEALLNIETERVSSESESESNRSQRLDLVFLLDDGVLLGR
jgi:hypothetical protein